MASSDRQEVAIRKRQQIDSSKRTMFIAVASSAFISGVALVVTFFLVQQIWFHIKVIGAKQDTLSTIKKNITEVDDLKDNVRVLETNEALNSVKSSNDSSALQVVLDALPTEPNADALGASLQDKFIGGVSGIRIDSLAVDNVDTEDGDGSIGFTMTVHGSADGLKELMTRFERSIRVIKLLSVNIQSGDDGLTMTIGGEAYYEPGRTIELGTEVVKP